MTDEPNDRAALFVVPMGNPQVAQAARAADADPLEERVGRQFAREFDDQFCYDHSRGAWINWTGFRWKPDKTDLAMDTMLQFTNQMRMMDPRPRKAMASLNFNRNALSIAAADRAMARAGEDFDATHTLAGTPTGYVDLETGIHHPPDRTKMISMCTGVAPADSADCPKWKDFLNWATDNDKALQHYLQKFFGYCLSGKMNEEIMTFIYGPGGNGKGVMLSILGRIMGDYYLSTPSSTFMASRHQEHATELARLQHRRLVSASETNEGDKWNISRIKEITGNENPISARFMRQDFFEFWPTCKLVIIGNSKPAFDDVDPAIARRLRLINFMQTPAAVNRNLKEEFNGEFASILRWIIDGYQLYRKEGLEPPDVVLRASQAYLGEQDIASEFIRNCLEFRSVGRLHRKDVQWALSTYLKRNGHTKSVKATRIYKRLEEEHGLSREEWHDGVRAFHGVNIKTEFWDVMVADLPDEEKPKQSDRQRGLILDERTDEPGEPS